MLTDNTFRGFHRGSPWPSIGKHSAKVRRADARGSQSGCRCIGERGKHEIACADRAFGAQFECGAAMMSRRHTIATSVGGALRRPDTVRLSVNNARNRSVPAIYHAVFASVSSAKHRNDHLIHYRSQKTHRKPRLTT
jgi:hypothetical protein